MIYGVNLLDRTINCQKLISAILYEYTPQIDLVFIFVKVCLLSL